MLQVPGRRRAVDGETKRLGDTGPGIAPRAVQPTAAEVDRRADRRNVDCERPPARTRGGLQHDGLKPKLALQETFRRRKPGRPGPNHHDIDLTRGWGTVPGHVRTR